ncbi:hypothetical protein Tco_0327680 [Tanacetum coccineum]
MLADSLLPIPFWAEAVNTACYVLNKSRKSVNVDEVQWSDMIREWWVAVADFSNMDDSINVSPIPTLRIYKDHPKDQILGDPKSAIQTRGKIHKASSAQQALKNPRIYHMPYKMKAGLKQCKRNSCSSNYIRNWIYFVDLPTWKEGKLSQIGLYE